MDKDEILEKSRKEHKDRDLVELEVINKANMIANVVGVMVCAALTLIHAVVQKRMDNSAWTVMFSIMSTVMLVKFARLRRRHELMIGLIYLLLTTIFFMWYLRDVLEVSGWTRA